VRRLRVLLLGVMLLGQAATAHRLSPAFFGLNETAEDVFNAEWKVSIPGGLADVLEPKIPEGCSVLGSVRSYVVEDARLLHAALRCDQGLPGKSFTVEGLSATDTDVLLRIQYLDGTSFTHRLIPDADSVVIPEQPGTLDVIGTYLALGVEHILLGIDHLLFVLALLLLVGSFKRLVATVTAFTVAHSITLGAATLGYVNVPSAPVEATIALSILFLATELARTRYASGRDVSERPTHLAERFPWLVAFTFGLLHGFGFAGALSEIGLPPNAIPLSLLFFNLGVELGQLMFVATVLLCGMALGRAAVTVPRWVPRLVVYAIGTLSALWVFERAIPVI